MQTLEIVINTTFGGFTVSKEMGEWLISNRQWKVVDENDHDFQTDLPLGTLLRSKWGYSPTDSGRFEFRSHPDLVACVRALQELHAGDKHALRREQRIWDLEVVEATVHIDVVDYHDGKEKIECWMET